MGPPKDTKDPISKHVMNVLHSLQNLARLAHVVATHRWIQIVDIVHDLVVFIGAEQNMGRLVFSRNWWQLGYIQGVRRALGHLRHPIMECAPFWALLRSEWSPLVGLGIRNFDARAHFRAMFLVWALHCRCKKVKNVSLQKIKEITQWTDQKCMSFDTSSLKNVRLT